MVVMIVYIAVSAVVVILSGIWAWRCFGADKKYWVVDYFTGRLKMVENTIVDRIVAAIFWGTSCAVLCALIGIGLCNLGVFN